MLCQHGYIDRIMTKAYSRKHILKINSPVFYSYGYELGGFDLDDLAHLQIHETSGNSC